MCSQTRSWTIPRYDDLELTEIENIAGLSVRVLPNACLFSIAHRHDLETILVNQTLGTPIDGGIARIVLRFTGPQPFGFEIVGPHAQVRFTTATDCFMWEGETRGMYHRVILSLHPHDPAWVWHIHVENRTEVQQSIETILVQDIGLGEPGFLMNNEAYASQYIDHAIAEHAIHGPVVMNRQNLAQRGRHPWVAHGCLDGAKGFATDAKQIFGPAYRDTDRLDIESGGPLPSEKLQHELACIAIQSTSVVVAPAKRSTWSFFGLFDPDHPHASQESDLARLDNMQWHEPPDCAFASVVPVQSHVQKATAAISAALTADEVARYYPTRFAEERAEGRLQSFFVPDEPHNRHVVLLDKERHVTRRHGAILRSGTSMLPDETTLCATCWMHGVFAAQLTIGNTSFHKLFSVSRDPYNIIRANGLRMLVDVGDGWQALTIPSSFEMGLSDCRWLYCIGTRAITVDAIAAGSDCAMQWRIRVDGDPCRFLVYGHVVLGEREFDHESTIEIDLESKSIAFRPDPSGMWGQRYPEASYHLVTSTPESVEALGGDDLLYIDEKKRSGAYFALRSQPTRDLCFSVVGSLTDPSIADRLATKYSAGVQDHGLRKAAKSYWTGVTKGLRIRGGGTDGIALDTFFPWLVHDAMIHLTVPHGLEQYTGGAWGTRDVCQGPIELLLSLEHDEPVKEILRIVFAQQYEKKGDWPQWFMLEPYSIVQDRTSHGDVIVWPLKALADYLEATNDLGFLDEPVAWRREDDFERTSHKAPIAEHVEKLLSTIVERFIPGTRLIRYGEGDWNDSLQPADPSLHDKMASSWTVALLYQQLVRYAKILHRVGKAAAADDIDELATAIRRDFNRFLVLDGTVAGYAIFGSTRGQIELLIHPSDERTKLHYSLLPMTRSIIAGLFTPEQTKHHLGLIREHLEFPDGVRLIDRPMAYHGGLQTVFKRAEWAAFFGREIGLMYVHAHLRYAEAMAVLGDADALLEALRLANPVTLAEHLAEAAPRQRNTYFTSSDAAFADRAAASAQWFRVKKGSIEFEAGWRLYSSGPGLYINMLTCYLLGHRRVWGERISSPTLPTGLEDLRVEFDSQV
jgi:cellobiose phosphorylase